MLRVSAICLCLEVMVVLIVLIVSMVVWKLSAT